MVAVSVLIVAACGGSPATSASTGTTVHFMRTDVAPGMQRPADIAKAQGLIAGINAALKVRAWVALGRLPEALDWVRQRGLSVDDELTYKSMTRFMEHVAPRFESADAVAA